MIRVTYLSHSGFAVTLDDAILVFDYHRDPAHALQKILDAHSELPVIFMVTHAHPDHFNPEIFHLAQNHRRVYVISNDVEAKLIPSNLEVAGISKGDDIEPLPGGVGVRAYGSTDEGVSLLVTTRDAKTIFHAGDLNDWHWKDESTPDEVRQAEHDYDVELNRLARDVSRLDIAMFPVDTRLGSEFWRGAKLFLDRIDVKDFFPMHFNGPHEEACDFTAYAPGRTVCHCLYEPGESINLN